MEREGDAAARAKAEADMAKEKGRKGKGKAVPTPAPQLKVARPDPSADECVKAKFHLDTQTPHVEISTVDSASGNIISTRI
jgi:hypothetical protein